MNNAPYAIAGILAQVAPASGTRTWDVLFWVMLAIAGLFGFIALIIISQYLQLWVQAWLSGAPVSLLKVIMMRLRKVPPAVIVL